MRKANGQALVEFVMILPVFLLLVFGAIDFGKIIYEKYRLQNDLDTISKLYIENRSDDLARYASSQEIQISYDEKIDSTIIIATKRVEIITPGLSNVLKNPYIVEESVTVFNET